MAKASQVYHKRDLYTEVTSRILTELESGLRLGSSLGRLRQGSIIHTMQSVKDRIAAASTYRTKLSDTFGGCRY